ncbi:hypothetical protein MMC25_001621 [Agyrium rufum]|nr:hypothetical protein [Agyrium rufum]
MPPKKSKQTHKDKTRQEESSQETAASSSTNGDGTEKIDFTSAEIGAIIKAIELLLLGALYSPISQASLSPVYGGLPPSLHHHRLLQGAALAGFVLKGAIQQYLPEDVAKVIPVLAFAAPMIQNILTPHSMTLGPVYGPLITELLTIFPIIVLSIYLVGVLADTIDLSRFGERIQRAAPPIASYFLFTTAQKAAARFLPLLMGSSLIFSRTGLQYVIAALYAFVLPSKLLMFAAAPFVYFAIQNPHLQLGYNTALLNQTLALQNYTILARQDSITGYISVIESTNPAFRVMRCDHSILGGEWTVSPVSGSQVKEPVYAIFTMLEAVRLIVSKGEEAKAQRPDQEKNALVVGLGIGTTPTALLSHGLNTTIVEIDPVVHRFATDYFGLPTNHTSVITDATDMVKNAQMANEHHKSKNPLAKQPLYAWDYIIHDVFTGGAEPISLFTQDFLTDLKVLLKPDGVIAINYAGDLLLPQATMVVKTVKAVFPSCRIYRENAIHPALTHESDNVETSATSENTQTHDSPLPERDFTNMVLFCRRKPGPFTFRPVVEADLLGSQARLHHLPPKFEVPGNWFDRENRKGVKKPLGWNASNKILGSGSAVELEGVQRENAIGHWKIMRTVMPSEIWEAW